MKFDVSKPAPWFWAACALFALGCSDESGGSTSGSTPSSTNGLPEGTSVFQGTIEVGPFKFLVDATLVNTGGKLTAAATFSDDPSAPTGFGTGTYALSGTHEPVSGELALAPNDWIQKPSIDSELLGLTATYDPVAKTLTGVMVDYATGKDNTLAGGALSLILTDGDGAATQEGDRAQALSAGSHTLTGTGQCTGPVRDTSGTLEYDGKGHVTGTVALGDTGLDMPLGTFAVTGVHNPSTGGLTLVPGLWINPAGSEPLTFFIDGSYDASSGAFEGDQRTNVNACPLGTWKATIQ